MEEFENEFNDSIDFSEDIELQNKIEELKKIIAYENYTSIIEKNIDIKLMINNNINIKPVINSLNDMLTIFINLEEYEKCAKIKSFTDKNILLLT
jgi:primosomal protein N''